MLPREWLNAFVPIGLLQNGSAWRPIGAGVLVFNDPFVWLVTANHVIPAKTGDHVGVFVTDKKEQKRVCIDLTHVHQPVGLSWIREATRDVAACLMPVAPDWEIKAITESLCIVFED